MALPTVVGVPAPIQPVPPVGMVTPTLAAPVGGVPPPMMMPPAAAAGLTLGKKEEAEHEPTESTSIDAQEHVEISGTSQRHLMMQKLMRRSAEVRCFRHHQLRYLTDSMD